MKNNFGLQNLGTKPELSWVLQNQFERVARARAKAAIPHPSAPRPYDPNQFMPRPDYIIVMATNGDISLMPFDDLHAALREGKVKVLRHPNNREDLFEESQLVDMPPNLLPARRITLNESFNLTL